MIPVPELQALPSRLAHLCLDVERFCRHSLKMADGDTWLLAVSGGADSTALLCIMALLAPRAMPCWSKPVRLAALQPSCWDITGAM